MLPAGAASLDEAHAAIELWEHYKRRTLDPTQRLTVEVMMATRADGLWAASTTGREMPRQNGKGDEIEVVELWGLVQRAERILHTVHDAVLLASETQTRLLSMLDGHPDLRRLKLRAWRGTGQQMIEMRNGGTIWYRTRTGSGARGVDEVDRIVIDEAQHAEEEHLSAVTPTTLASANPQLNAIGSAGIAGKSAWWWRVRKRAVSVDSGAFGYVGHTVESLSLDAEGRVSQSDVDVNDRQLWRNANPALVVGRVGEDFFDEQLRRLGPALFAREHLGVWDPDPLGVVDAVIPLNIWRRQPAPYAKTSQASVPLVHAVDVTPDRSRASVALSGRNAGNLAHVEVVANDAGVDWVAASLAGKTVVVDPGSPAGSLIGDLERAGATVVEVSARQYAQACGSFFDDVVEGKLVHVGQQVLDDALAGARKRNVGDAWAWDRRSSSADISPLVAVTLARWGLDNAPSKQFTGSFYDLADYLAEE